MLRRNIKKKLKRKKKEIVNIDDDKENFNEKINLQNDEHEDNTNLNRIDHTR